VQVFFVGFREPAPASAATAARAAIASAPRPSAFFGLSPSFFVTESDAARGNASAATRYALRVSVERCSGVVAFSGENHTGASADTAGGARCAARTAEGTLAEINRMLESVIFTAANASTQTLRDTVVVAVETAAGDARAEARVAVDIDGL
jgi:hypothetical protein